MEFALSEVALESTCPFYVSAVGRSMAKLTLCFVATIAPEYASFRISAGMVPHESP